MHCILTTQPQTFVLYCIVYNPPNLAHLYCSIDYYPTNLTHVYYSTVLYIIHQTLHIWTLLYCISSTQRPTIALDCSVYCQPNLTPCVVVHFMAHGLVLYCILSTQPHTFLLYSKVYYPPNLAHLNCTLLNIIQTTSNIFTILLN